MTLVSRDPFGRIELHRREVWVQTTCDNCGQAKPGRYRGKLFSYRWEHDGGRVSPIRGLFCSVGCMRSYHN